MGILCRHAFWWVSWSGWTIVVTLDKVFRRRESGPLVGSAHKRKQSRGTQWRRITNSIQLRPHPFQRRYAPGFLKKLLTLGLGSELYTVVRTSKRRLRQVDFRFDGREIRGLEQNPDTKSMSAATARERKKVMQFLVEGRYVPVVVEGEVKLYGGLI